MTPVKSSKEGSYRENKTKYKHNSFNKNFKRGKNTYGNERKQYRNYYKDTMINDIPEKYINSFYQWDNEKYYNQEETDQNGYKYDYINYREEDGELDYNYDSHYSYENTNYYQNNEMNPQSDPTNHAHTHQLRQYEWELFLYDMLSKEMEQETQEICIQVNLIKEYRLDIK